MKLLSIGLSDEEGRPLEVAWKTSLLRRFGVRLGGYWILDIVRIKGYAMHCFRS